MDWSAKWIWRTQSGSKNQWVCFRKKFTLQEALDRALVRITADSRYQLYINGEQVAMGPARGWPFEQSYDVLEAGGYLHPGENVIAVSVNFYGESTSQYVHGRGGLLFQMEGYLKGEERLRLGSDGTWKWTVHEAYTGGLCRINVAQPWMEVYDAARFPADWTGAAFPDDLWTRAEVVGEVGCEPWISLQERKVPLFARKERYAWNILKYEEVESTGCHACVNVRDNFFPGSSDSTDKGFLGYLATCIEAPCDMRGQISLVCRKSPATPERMKLNGEEILFTEEEDKKDVILREGSNFLLIDISGYHQRFNMNYYFEFPYPLSFQAPCRGKEDSREKSGFVTVGPFQAGNILNIAAIDKPLDFENPDYQAVWEVEDVNGLQKFAEVLQAVMGDHCITKNPHMLTMTDRVLKKLPIPGDMRYMVLQSPQPFVLEASEQEVRITIDFGEELSGLFGFDLDAPEGVIIDADFAECYNQQQFEFSKDMNSGFRYYTRKGRQRYESHLRRGFRYALLTFRNLTADTAVYGIQTTELSYPELKRGSFTCSDWELNQIWQISRRSVELCMEDTFVDCPAFEQACWIGDARIEALVSYYTHGAYELTKNSIGMVGGSLRQSELPDAQVPTGCSTMITAWLLLWLLSCKEYYEYTGDMNGLDAVYDDMLLTIRRLDRHMNEDGLLEIDGWNMLDWAGMDTPVSGVVTHQNALLVKVLRETGDIARIRKDDKTWGLLSRKAERIRQAMNRILWEDDRQAFIDCIHRDKSRSGVVSIQTNIMAYLCGCVEEERGRILAGYITDPPADFVQIGSPFMAFFYYEALERTGAYKTLIRSIKDRWGEMLRYGATTCWETFPGFETDRLTRSHCHGWSSAPGFFLPRTILGVKPLKPGFRKIMIAPETCGLTWARGEVPTPFGSIHVEWEIRDGKLHLDADVPEEITYEIQLPEI